MRHNRSKGVMFFAILLVISMCGGAMAYSTPICKYDPEVDSEPRILGNFTMALEIINVNDLYAWQAVLFYDSKKLVLLKVEPGELLLSANDYIFVNSSDSVDNILLLGGTMLGSVKGYSGSGIIAVIVFGYTNENYRYPVILDNFKNVYSTYGLNSYLNTVPLRLKLSVISSAD